jgi:hypothetical protein
MKIIKFDSNSKKLILKALGKSIDKEGFIVEQDYTKQRVSSLNGEDVKLEDFGGYKKGSDVFIKKDIGSLIDFYDRVLCS